MSTGLELRDIHAAPPPDWWPPAPGWWLLTLIGLLLTAWFARWALKRYRARRRERALVAELAEIRADYESHGDAHRYGAALALYLRRLIVRFHGRKELAGAHGSQWAQALAEVADDDAALQEAARWAAWYQYAPRSDQRFSPEALHALARRWTGVVAGVRAHERVGP